MPRVASAISTVVLVVAVGCGGRESGTGRSAGMGMSTGGGSLTGGSGNAGGNNSGTHAGDTGSGSVPSGSTGSSWSSLPLCPVTAFQTTLVWAVTCYPAAASPEGTACSETTTACGFCSFVECGGVTDQSHSPRQFYSCSCVNGQQQCSLVDQDEGACALAEAGVPVSDAGAPLYHRATAATCPPQRGPGTPNLQPVCNTPLDQPVDCCESDSECDAGINGRCIDFGHPLPDQQQCTYDECFRDSNCPSGAPCICRGNSPIDNAWNTCAAGGNCVVDSDCGPGGFCSPSPSPLLNGCEDPGPYYCHTASDTCTDNTDCAVDGGRAFCAYDPKTQHWACNPELCAP
jgi:hypothetical protein